ncbi:MAG TPA: UDP-N-acetylglucosamine 1-carboxyvinyltransferase [Chloroflexota bacterium]|nr:UDP-N-acetylglucosamine 1-carboxyvinyltransferase [Chloroflexota bacterium]
MSNISVTGATPLHGDVTISGSKNAALPIMAATLLTKEPMLLENVPKIADVDVMCEVLRSLGATVEIDDNFSPPRMLVQAAELTSRQPPLELVGKLRASFVVVGPLLAREGEAHSPEPGGDVIGYRPIDMHIKGFQALGAEIKQEGGLYACYATRLQGTKIFLDYPSVTGTENVLMAAVLAEGHTTIKNAAQEPEILDLIDCLNAMGAKIQRVGANQLEIEGVARLHGARWRVIPDRIEAGTLAIAAAATGGEVTLERVVCDHLEAFTEKLQEVGVEVTQRWDSLAVRSKGDIRSTVLTTFPYPGFPTDLQAPFGALLTQAQGESLIHELLYDDRLLYLKEMAKMGAHATIEGQFARVLGPSKLHGATVSALDIRSGAALIIAALAADGSTTITDKQHIERGYADVVAKLSQLGAAISDQ